ncbi:sensor histidine kinase [Streptomyces violaceorubidus]
MGGVPPLGPVRSAGRRNRARLSAADAIGTTGGERRRAACWSSRPSSSNWRGAGRRATRPAPPGPAPATTPPAGPSGSPTWPNPLFAFYAVVGYFGVGRQLPRRLGRAGLFATAVTLAGSQSGGLPPGGGMGWVLFGAILMVNGMLVALFAHFGALEEARVRARVETIAELERSNRVAAGLDENAAVHAELLVRHGRRVSPTSAGG